MGQECRVVSRLAEKATPPVSDRAMGVIRVEPSTATTVEPPVTVTDTRWLSAAVRERVPTSC